MILTLVLFYFSSGHELTGQPDELDYVYSASHWSKLSPMEGEGNMSLVIFEIDKAITDKCLEEPTLLDILHDLHADAKSEREKQNSKLMGCYEIEKIN
jgi:hypothetical protein